MMRSVMSARSPSMVRTRPSGSAVLDHHRRRQRIADGAELLVPGDALEIEGAGAAGPAGGERLASTSRRSPTASGGAPLPSDTRTRAGIISIGGTPVALQPHRLEHDAHASGQTLDVGDAALDVDAEQRPAERRCGQAREVRQVASPKPNAAADQADRTAPAPGCRPAPGRRRHTRPPASAGPSHSAGSLGSSK